MDELSPISISCGHVPVCVGVWQFGIIFKTSYNLLIHFLVVFKGYLRRHYKKSFFLDLLQLLLLQRKNGHSSSHGWQRWRHLLHDLLQESNGRRKPTLSIHRQDYCRTRRPICMPQVPRKGEFEAFGAIRNIILYGFR